MEQGEAASPTQVSTALRFNFRWKASLLDLNECSLLSQRDSISRGPWGSRPHTQIIFEEGSIKFCFLNKGVGRMEGTHKYCQWEPGLPFTPPSAWRDESRKRLPEGTCGKDWWWGGCLSGAELEWRSAKGSLPGNQGNKPGNKPPAPYSLLPRLPSAFLGDWPKESKQAWGHGSRSQPRPAAGNGKVERTGFVIDPTVHCSIVCTIHKSVEDSDSTAYGWHTYMGRTLESTRHKCKETKGIRYSSTVGNPPPGLTEQGNTYQKTP